MTPTSAPTSRRSRVAPDPKAQGPSQDDLLALADAVREAGRPQRPPVTVPSLAEEGGVREVQRRGHLRMLSTD